MHALVFPFASRRLSELEIFVKRLRKRTSPDCNKMEYRDSSFRSLQPHQQPTLAVGITPTTFTQAPFNQPQVFPTQSNANKNMRQTLVHTAEVTGCPVPVHFLLSPSLNSQSARSVPVVPPFTCFTASGKPTAVHRAALLHAAALKAVLPSLSIIKFSIHVIVKFLYLTTNIMKA